MRHEMKTSNGRRGQRLASQLVRTAVITGIAMLVGAQLVSLPMSTASAKNKGKGGGFGSGPHAGGNIPAYCFSGSNLLLQVTNAPTGTLPNGAPFAQFSAAIALGTSTGSAGFVLIPGQNGYTETVSFTDQNGILRVENVGSDQHFVPPLRNKFTLYTVTGTFNCSDGSTRTASRTFVAPS